MPCTQFSGTMGVGVGLGGGKTQQNKNIVGKDCDQQHKEAQELCKPCYNINKCSQLAMIQNILIEHSLIDFTQPE